jgi:demethylmenaquinone methyltransferase/2-methoxy-6-polyprenyl-1,4-benzoquinol methylase
MNYLTSFGFSICWRKQFIAALPPSAEPVRVLDLLTGMGETWSHIQKQYPKAEISALDFSEGMLKSAEVKNKAKFQKKFGF